jgi:hypothetical protein
MGRVARARWPLARASDYHEGLIWVAGKPGGFQDKDGKPVIEAKFDAAWEFDKGLARVMLGDKEGYIDHGEKYVWEPTE